MYVHSVKQGSYGKNQDEHTRLVRMVVDSKTQLSQNQYLL
jgi:hypothetical protein